VKVTATARMIRVHIGEDDRWHGRPLHEAIVEAAHREDIAGATVYRGIEGYGASSRIHRTHLLTSSDLPITICIIDQAPAIERFLPVLQTMIGEGLIATEEVRTIRYAP
jgi:PII-like signaling protein